MDHFRAKMNRIRKDLKFSSPGQSSLEKKETNQAGSSESEGIVSSPGRESFLKDGVQLKSLAWNEESELMRPEAPTNKQQEKLMYDQSRDEAVHGFRHKVRHFERIPQQCQEDCVETGLISNPQLYYPIIGRRDKEVQRFTGLFCSTQTGDPPDDTSPCKYASADDAPVHKKEDQTWKDWEVLQKEEHRQDLVGAFTLTQTGDPPNRHDSQRDHMRENMHINRAAALGPNAPRAP